MKAVAYRCPYCKELFAAEPPPRCPRCGRIMIVAAMREESSRAARKRRIEQLWRENAAQKAELRTPTFATRRNPRLYFGMVAILAILGGAIFKATDKAVARRTDLPHSRAIRQIDTLATALGRYAFHVGAFPSSAEGLRALVRDPGAPGWDGPYINQLIADPWGSPYLYEEPGTNSLPLLLSLGRDKLRATADDISPLAERFDPGTDWTNGWVPAAQRRSGVQVVY